MTAITIESKYSALRFSEVVNVRGEFGDPPLVSPLRYLVQFPKGIAYHPGIDRVLLSVTQIDRLAWTPYPNEGEAVILQQVSADGTRKRFGGDYSGNIAVEGTLVVVPPGHPVDTAHFTKGDIYVNSGPDGVISRLDSSGNVVGASIILAGLDGLWGGLAFDQTGEFFGGQLVAVGRNGMICFVDSTGKCTYPKLQSLTGMCVEGISVAPKAFGPLHGQIMVGVEGFNDSDEQSGRIYAVDHGGVHTLLADIGYCAENILFVPEMGGTLYQTQFTEENKRSEVAGAPPLPRERENKLLMASASQFLARAGRMLVTCEMSGELWEVAWDSTRQTYTQSLAGRVPGRWNSEGLDIGSRQELEQADFAVRAPLPLKWVPWRPGPGDIITDVQPNACFDYGIPKLHLFIKRKLDGRIYETSSQDGIGWGPWGEVRGGMTTRFSPASVLHDGTLHVFVVQHDGQIMQLRFMKNNQTCTDGWKVVPGSFVTDAAVSATVATGRLALCAKGSDNQIYINELACGGRSWGGWSLVPDCPLTDNSPAVVNFLEEMYIIVKRQTDNRIHTSARSADGCSWSDWAELPGSGQTDTAVAAASYYIPYPPGSTDLADLTEQCVVLAKGLGVNKAPQINVASNTGTWIGWTEFPISTPGTTDAPLAMAAIPNRIYLFAKSSDGRITYCYTS